MSVLIYGRCERMHAAISERQCTINKERGMFSCAGCPGLSNTVDIETAEETIVGKQICKVERCEKQAQQNRDGMCHAHWRESTGTPRLKPGIKPPAQNDRAPATRASSSPAATGLKEAPKRGLTELLADTGLTVSVPTSLADRMAAADVTADDILELVEMLLAGKLRKAA